MKNDAYHFFVEEFEVLQGLFGQGSTLKFSEDYKALASHSIGLSHPDLDNFAETRKELVQVRSHFYFHM